MVIPSGTRLGPYEVASLIGAGGMGEVYKARDTRLDRVVAIKVLPAHLADRTDLRERFEREARTIAGLNHPHICTLHDIGQQDGIAFLVMEYLEGETLAMRLLKGPLPIEQALRYAIEISDALDKAHRSGATHRDIKPGNIMLTKSGSKLLDFGLAKLKQEVAPAVPVSQLPTLSQNPTVEGTILGTLQYMSPEQLEGKVDEIDSRTDIFSFGAVVYEMATGKKAFEGKSSVSLIGAILKDTPPPISSLQPMTPPALDRVVRKCLAKEPEKRWQAASDVCDELKWIAEGGAQAAPVHTSTVAAKGTSAVGRRQYLMTGLALLLGAAIAGLAIWNLRPAPPQPVTRTVITLPSGERLASLEGIARPAVAISPDGSQLAYVSLRGAAQQLYLRAMDRLEAPPVSGTDGAQSPFFSPDGRWLGFFAGGKLKKVSVSGGAAVTLADADPFGGSWGAQDTIVFSPRDGRSLVQISGQGGTPQLLTSTEEEGRWPEVLPGGKGVLFTFPIPGRPVVAIHSVETGQRRNLIEGGTQPRYASSGHLVYAQGGTLMAAPFDRERLEITGAAVPVLEGVLESPLSGAAQYSLSATGTLVYVPGVQALQRTLVWVSRNGAEQPASASVRSYVNPRLSPDGRHAALGVEEGSETQVWLYDFGRETLTRLTFEGNTNDLPAWTPDGRRVVFYSTKEGQQDVFSIMADGSGGLERLTTSNSNEQPRSWSPDGRLLSFNRTAPATGRDIWVLQLPGRDAQPFVQTSFVEGSAQFSPDGRWMAYVSNESGRPEIYTQPYPGPGRKWQISTGGGTEPVWNPNGRELFYRSGNQMMAAQVTLQPTFSAGRPRMLFEGPYVLTPFPQTNPAYDVTPDGQRFLMIKESGQVVVGTQINVVLNWFEELKRRVPPGTK